MYEIAAKVYRGRVAEALHHAVIAVVDRTGAITHSLGDPETSFMTRSLVKPFQMLPLVLSGAVDHFGYNQQQLAVMCSSHTGSDEHREVVLSNLKQAGNGPEDLQCGVHLPMYLSLEKKTAEHGEDRDPLRHNCSGKHSGFLALSKFLDEDIADYLNPRSKVQTMVRQVVGDMCRYPAEQIEVGIDGCSAPVFALPVKNLAKGFKRLAAGEGDSSEMSQAVGRIYDAMTSYPFMISGEKRLDYDIMRSFPGNVVCKIGAEAIEGIGFAEPSIGICVKIVDGNERALGPVVVEVFRQLGLIKKIDDFPHLLKYIEPEVKNYREIVTGHIIPEFKLKKA